MSASIKDSAAGWKIFKQSNYAMEMNEINRQLKNLVIDRLLTNLPTLCKLHRHGYTEYIPINQLDVMTERGTSNSSHNLRY